MHIALTSVVENSAYKDESHKHMLVDSHGTSSGRYILARNDHIGQLHKNLHPLLKYKNNFYLTLVILKDYSIHIDTISMKLSILYFKGSRLPVKISTK